MKQTILQIFLVLALLLPGCTEAETESPKATTDNPASQSDAVKETQEKVMPETNDSAKQQHLSGAESTTSDETSEPELHVSGSTSPVESKHVSGQ